MHRFAEHTCSVEQSGTDAASCGVSEFSAQVSDVDYILICVSVITSRLPDRYTFLYIV
jgi:hypothetical protein